MSQFIADSLLYTSNAPTTSRLLSATSRPLSNACTPWTVNLRSTPENCVTIKDLRFYRDFAPTFQFATKIFIKHDEHPHEEDEHDEEEADEIDQDAAVGDGSTSQNNSSSVDAEDEISDIVDIIRPMTRFLKKFGWGFSHRSSGEERRALPPRIIDELLLQMPSLKVADIFSSSSPFNSQEIESFASILTKSSSLGLKFHVAILSAFRPLRSRRTAPEPVQSIFKKYDIVEIVQERAIKFCRDEDPSCLPYFLNIMLSGIDKDDEQEDKEDAASDGDRKNKNKKNTLVEKFAPMIDFLEFILNCQDYFKALPTNRAIWLLFSLVDFIMSISLTRSNLQVFVDKFNLCALLERVFDISEMILSSSLFLDKNHITTQNDNKNISAGNNNNCEHPTSNLHDLAVTVVKCFALAHTINNHTMWRRISQKYSGDILSFARDGGRSFEFFPMERLQKFLLGVRKVFTLAALKKKKINTESGRDDSTASNEPFNLFKPVKVCAVLGHLIDIIAEECFSDARLADVEEEIKHGHTPSFIELQIVPIFCQIILECDFIIKCDTMDACYVFSALERATGAYLDYFGDRQRSPLCVRVAVARAFASSIDVLNSLLQCADKVLQERLEETPIARKDPHKFYETQRRYENLDDFVHFVANLADGIADLLMTEGRSFLDDGVGCFDEELLSSVRSQYRQWPDSCHD